MAMANLPITPDMAYHLLGCIDDVRGSLGEDGVGEYVLDKGVTLTYVVVRDPETGFEGRTAYTLHAPLNSGVWGLLALFSR